MAEPEGTDRRRDLPPGVVAAVVVLVLAPIVALMLVGTYAKHGPELWGFPFFYWYQLLWVFLAVRLHLGGLPADPRARRGGPVTTASTGSR